MRALVRVLRPLRDTPQANNRLLTFQRRRHVLERESRLQTAAEVALRSDIIRKQYASVKPQQVERRHLPRGELLWTERAIHAALSRELGAHPVDAIDMLGDGQQYMLMVVSDVFRDLPQVDRRSLVKSVVEAALTSAAGEQRALLADPAYTAPSLPPAFKPPPPAESWNVTLLPKDVKLRTPEEHRAEDSVGHQGKQHVSYPFRRAFQLGAAGKPDACKALLERLGSRPGLQAHVGPYGVQIAASAEQEDRERVAKPQVKHFDEGVMGLFAAQVGGRLRREAERGRR